MVMTQNITLIFMLISMIVVTAYYIRFGYSIKEIYLVAASVFITIVSFKNMLKPHDFSLIYNLYFTIALYAMSSLIMPSTKNIYYITLVNMIAYMLSILSFISVDDPKILLVIYTSGTIVFLTLWYTFVIKTFTLSSTLIFLYNCLMIYVFIRCEQFDKTDIKTIIIFSQIMSFLTNTSYIVKSYLNVRKQKYFSEKD